MDSNGGVATGPSQIELKSDVVVVNKKHNDNDIPFKIDISDNVTIQEYIIKLALQIYLWKDYTVAGASQCVDESIKKAEEFVRQLYKKGYITNTIRDKHLSLKENIEWATNKRLKVK